MAGEDGVRDDDARDDAHDQLPGVPVEQPGGVPPVLSGPAPVIDLGEDGVPVRPAKPLGPRRLARLQRELAERSRELEETGGDPADPELLDKQRRFAELAAQAGAAQPGPDRSDAGTATTDPAPVVVEPAGPAGMSGTGEPPAVVPGGLPEPTEQITVVFPGGDGSEGPAGHSSHDPVHVDPALFSNRLAPEELAALTHIEIVAPGDAGPHGSHEHATAGHHTDAPGTHEDPGDAVEPPPASPGLPADTAQAWAEDEPPADPVPAGAAGGLQLLQPREYRRRAGTAWWVLLLPAVLAALAVVLVLLVL